MKRIFTIFLLLMFAVIPLFTQTSQCIFKGEVMIHGEIFPNPCSTEPPIIQLMFPDGDSGRNAFYNPSTQTYGVNAFSSDGFNDSDVVMFRIIYNCDTLIARTSGDESIFIGTPAPMPPEPREVNLANNRTPSLTEIVSDTVWDQLLYQRQMFAFDADRDAVTFSLIGAPPWLSIDEQTGMIQGTPGFADIGAHQITVEVNDGYFRGTSRMTYTLHVFHINRAPWSFHLLTPTMFDTLEFHPSDNVHFSWQRSLDEDKTDIVGYQFVIVNLLLDTLRFTTTDTFKTIAMTQLQPWMVYAWSVFATDGFATVAASDTFFFFLVDANDVQELPGIPTTYALEQNYPNPFNPSTVFSFKLPVSGWVTLKVFDVEGKEIAVLVNEQLAAGIYQTTWSASGIAGGTYFYQLQTKNYSETRKLMLLK